MQAFDIVARDRAEALWRQLERRRAGPVGLGGEAAERIGDRVGRRELGEHRAAPAVSINVPWPPGVGLMIAWKSGLGFWSCWNSARDMPLGISIAQI